MWKEPYTTPQKKRKKNQQQAKNNRNSYTHYSFFTRRKKNFCNLEAIHMRQLLKVEIDCYCDNEKKMHCMLDYYYYIALF